MKSVLNRFAVVVMLTAVWGRAGFRNMPKVQV